MTIFGLMAIIMFVPAALMLGVRIGPLFSDPIAWVILCALCVFSVLVFTATKGVP